MENGVTLVMAYARHVLQVALRQILYHLALTVHREDFKRKIHLTRMDARPVLQDANMRVHNCSAPCAKKENTKMSAMSMV